jgi:hypothetical protein
MPHGPASVRDPLVSVVCTAYNRGAAIRRTLRSVLDQSVRELELLVVSDGSTDDTHEHVEAMAAEDPRLRLIVLEHSGIASRAINAGVADSRGRHVAYIDHDDLWAPHHLEVAVRELELGADLVATAAIWERETGEVISVRPPAGLFWHPDVQVLHPVFENSQAVHRAEWADRAGPWAEARHGLEDWDMWLRMSDAGARVSTVQTHTVHKVMGRSNRYLTIPRAHTTELVRCPDGFAARAALRAMLAPEAAAELERLAFADTTRWYTELAADEAFVFPRGFADSRAEAIAAVPAAVRESREADRGIEDPVSIRIVRHADHATVVRDLECVTAEHARRYDEVLRRALPGYFSRLAELMAPFSTAPTPAGA